MSKSTSTQPPKLAADHIREMIRHHVTAEKITRYVPIPNVGEQGAWRVDKQRVTITHLPLLDQLEEAVTQSRSGGAYGGGAAKSKPAARLDAIGTIQRIDSQSAQRATDLGLAKMTLRARLQAISGKIGDTEDSQVKSWWIAARCATGWEKAPYEPDVPCPSIECERRGTLRIRLDDYIATCTACGATWDEDNYWTLGKYVQYASEHLRGPRHEKFNAQGYPVECDECRDERALMEERRAERQRAARAAKAAEKTRKAG